MKPQCNSKQEPPPIVWGPSETHAIQLDKVIITMVMWSGSSMTTYIVLDLHSLIWGFGESRTIVYFITLQPADVS